MRADTPSQRVQFILGTEDDDAEHVPHDLFTELDELSFRHGSHTEWKETARSESTHLLLPHILLRQSYTRGQPFMMVKHDSELDYITVAHEKVQNIIYIFSFLYKI